MPSVEHPGRAREGAQQYGEPKQQLTTTFGYTGHRHEQDMGLVDANGRFYDPKLGIFLSADPVGPFGGGSPRMNRYAYVGYDPVNFVDPTGTIGVTAVLVFGPVLLALLPPTLNYLATGNFSYDYDEDTWKGLASILGGIGAGVGCGLAAGPVAGAFCAGLVGSGISAGFSPGSSASDVALAAFQGAILGAVAAGVGVALSEAIVAGAQNPYKHATLQTATTAGMNIAAQLVYTGQVDFGQVAIQTSVSGIQAFYRAAQMDQAMREVQARAGAALGQQMGRAYSAASTSFPFEIGIDELGPLPPDGPTGSLGRTTDAWLNGLHPVARSVFRQIVGEAQAILGISGYIRDGFRDYASQAAVNPANTGVPPGGSFHQFGRAIDVTITDSGRLGNIARAYEMLGHLAETHAGVTSGYFWDPPDYGHIQLDWRIQATSDPLDPIKIKTFWDSRFRQGQDLFAP
jgi:RHS repeat-associated protein